MFISYVIFSVCVVAIALWGSHDVKLFLEAYATIDGAPALEAFKRLARRNMIGALIYLPLGLISFLWSVYLVLNSPTVGLAVVLAVQAPAMHFFLQLKKLEDRARSLDAANDALREEHRRVGESWLKKALPDF